MTEKISGGAFKQMVAFGAACITAQKQAINDLNVFPVPDGDTGTNMSLTIQTAVDGAAAKPSPPPWTRPPSMTACGPAAGRPGQLRRHPVPAVPRHVPRSSRASETADGRGLWPTPCRRAWPPPIGAVMKPAEGTVLTVSRLAAAAGRWRPPGENNDAGVRAGGGHSGRARTTLAETIDMNPVLKKAGVVDAGGKGYLIILEGMLRGPAGRAHASRWRRTTAPRTRRTSPPSATRTSPSPSTPCSSSARPPTMSIWTPCRAYLNSIGDSLVIGEDDEAFKVHVHTDTPGAGPDRGPEIRHAGAGQDREYAHPGRRPGRRQAGPEHRRSGRRRGRAGGQRRGRRGRAGEALRLPGRVRRRGPGGRVPRPGRGPHRLRRPDHEPLHRGHSAGGRTAPPARSCSSCPTTRTSSWPPSSAWACTEKEVIVVPTATVPQGISAMMAVDPEDADPQAILAAMTEAPQNVTTAQITYAARNSDFDGFAISEGDYLALT